MIKSITIDQFQRTLRVELPYIALAAIVLIAGLAALVLWRLRSRDPLLLWLGAFASVYAVRLFLQNGLVRIALGAGSAHHAIAVMTYCIPIPYVLFFRELLGPGWRNSITVWLWAEIAFAPLGIAAGVVAGHPWMADRANAVLVLAGTLLALVNLYLKYRLQPGAAALRYATVAFLGLVLWNNVGGRIAGRNLEPVGFLVLLCGLGYTAARRTVAREEQLLAVEHELQTARRIQTSILPSRLPEARGLCLAARYEPMTAVAGDFYDFLPIDDRRLTILVADVSGHGVPAALIASMLKVAFSAQAANAADPAKVLAGLNQALAGAAEGQFVTAACAFIDVDAHRVTYAGAGHPPSLLLHRQTSEVVELAENGLFLGPFRQARYTNTSAPFEPGDCLLLYTDGITEATLDDGEPLGGEGLKTLLRKLHGVEVSSLADRLIQHVARPVREDDLTVVLAQAE